ncbi:MAG: immunoglobulin domain-containing protein [Opitutales bacterium]
MLALSLFFFATVTRAQNFTYQTLNDPDGYDTYAYGISGGNIVGQYTDDGDMIHGFLYNTTTGNYTTLDDPLAAPARPGYTEACGIDGGNIVGTYLDGNSNEHSFLYNLATNTYTTLDAANSTFINGNVTIFRGTYATGISGGNIVGWYEDNGGDFDGFIYHIATDSYTILNDPNATSYLPDSRPPTIATGIDGDNIVGYYEQEFLIGEDVADSSKYGFLYNITTQTYTTFYDPNGNYLGTTNTYPNGISGGNIVGYYYDDDGVSQGFLYNTASQTYTTLYVPIENAGSNDYVTSAYGIDGTNIVGEYMGAAVSGFLATLTANSAPAITTQPGNESVTAGNSTTFTAAANGTPTPTLQWQISKNDGTTWDNLSDGGNISGATTDTLTLGNVTLAQSGDKFQLLATNSAGNATSDAVTLTVNSAHPPPTITTQPVSTAALAGNSANFTVVATGTGPLTYQWYFNTKKISGAITATCTIAKAAAANVGNYDVVVKNSNGNVTSSVATFSLLTIPKITVQPKALTLAYGASGNLTVAATGTPPLNYHWHLNNAVITDGNVTGVTNSTLTFLRATSIDAGSYTVSVSGNYGSVTSTIAKLTVKVTAPKITKPPVAQKVAAGATVIFSVTASGSNTPLMYQWTFNSGNVTAGNATGAQSPQLTLTSVTSANAGSYQVTVTNTAGSAKSSTVKLAVQ